MLSLRIGDVWAQQIGDGHLYDAEVNWVRSASGGGLNSIKWSMDLPPKYWHQAFAPGTRVEAFRGDVKLGSGVMAEPDRTNWNFVADGLFKEGAKFASLDPNGGTSENLRTTITNANARGLGWNGFGNIPNITVAIHNGSTIAAALSAYCQANGMRWGLDENDVPFVDADPYLYHPDSIPQWAVSPGKPLMPISDDIFTTRVNVRYVGGGVFGDPNTYDVATSSVQGDYTLPGGRELNIIASPAGISGGAAQAIADEVMRRNSLRYGFTEGLNIFPGELTTPGGTPIFPWMAYTLLGKMGLHYGAINRLNWSAVGETVQWVMGSVTWRPEDDSLKIASVDFQPRTLKGEFEILRSLRASFQADT